MKKEKIKQELNLNLNLNLRYDLTLESGPVLRPSFFKVWSHDSHPRDVPATLPLKYRADLLLGCSYLALQTNHPSTNAKENAELWRHTEPHLAFFNESQQRIQAMVRHVDPAPKNLISDFETKFNSGLRKALKPEGFDLRELVGLIDCIHALESEIRTPILYNFSCRFSEETMKNMQMLEAFLFHLRNLVAIDFNNQIDDPSHEALKVDSVTDYLPKGDYVVSDAVLYWQIKKLTHPFVAGKQSDVRIEKLLVQPIESAFKKFAHNACHLIDHLPSSFLKAVNAVDLEDTLYLIQMDWLLGSGTGLLFKIREELFGLQNGYEKIFWPELENRPPVKAAQLSLNLNYTMQEILGHKKSA